MENATYDDNFYDGVLSNVIQIIQLTTPKNDSIQFNPNSDSLSFIHIFTEMSIVYAQLVGKSIGVVGMGFFQRRKFTKVFGVKFKKVNKKQRILDVQQIKDVIVKTYKDNGVVLSDRIFKEVKNYYYNQTKGN